MLEKLLKQSIKDIPRPFGIFLSGGLDSGILAAIAKPDFAITCSFNGEYYDELEYAESIADHLDIPLSVVTPDGSDFKDTLGNALEVIGHPVNSVSIYPWYKIMEEASLMGATTMIGGEGADETFGGYSRYLILKEIIAMYEMESLQGYHPMLNKIFGSFADTHSKLCGVPRETLLKRYSEKEGIINKIGWAEFNESLKPIIAMEFKLAEHFGIDLHLPFIDKKIQDYGWSLPDDQKIQGEIRKLKVYEIAKKHLPTEVWQRKDKKGFISPCNEWCGSNQYDKTNYLKLQEELCNQ